MWISQEGGSFWNSVKSLMGVGLFCLVAISVKAQTAQEWTNQKQLQTAYKINQIVALNGYLEVAKKGYQIAKIGWKVVGDIQQEELLLHSDYFVSLSAVPPIVSEYPQVPRILKIQRQINREIAWMDVFLRKENELESSEKLTASRLNESTLYSSTRIISQLEAILSPHSYEMNDGERVAALDELHREILSLYHSFQVHSKGIRFLNWSRKRNELASRQFNVLYDVN
ncbi:hypothetical protein [Algoriphagus aquimarinus]|uniref:hypothetical protein n=1 Tax=Algoriphagus aquimarinus TaxID=237018 RepID=UPI0030D898AD|tara:strand:- start:9946 stop:10626 length:681 start_codon:yes stop_codon:yes gene_type:complete